MTNCKGHTEIVRDETALNIICFIGLSVQTGDYMSLISLRVKRSSLCTIHIVTIIKETLKLN